MPMNTHADVILPLAVASSYTYQIPEGMNIEVGMLVRVPLGKSKHYTAVVYHLRQEAPNTTISYKNIDVVVSDRALLNTYQLELWAWIADYYCAPLGAVYKAAVPSILMKGDYRPKQVTMLSLTTNEQVKLTPKQEQALTSFTDLAQQNAMEKRVFLQEGAVTPAVLSALLKKELLEESQKISTRLNCSMHHPIRKAYQLHEAQKKAYLEINSHHNDNKTVLLHGVTSAGKTEVYIHLILDVIAKKQQALYLVPEIALTTQLTERLQAVFGDSMVVYHSKLSDNERAEVYLELENSNRFSLVVGVRSSVFLPFDNLGLVIVDEEHEASYKQYDPAPRYHARNVALVLAQMHQANVLLGTATPAVETYYNAQSGKYALVELTERYQNIELPEVLVVNVQEAYKKNLMRSMFSKTLLNMMQEKLDKGEQIILFQNRRGFSSFLECTQCGWVPKCVACDVSLTYHKSHNQLVCHYCGHTERTPLKCPSCGSHEVKDRGFGTEKVVEELQQYFPDEPIARMDLDTTQKKAAHANLIHDFEEGKLRILVGTQMVAKGLDFDKVSLVGILNADNLFSYPDFRASERAFQMLVQVSGRAGRKNGRGTVILQTYQPDNPLIPAIVDGDYTRFVEQELEERSLFRYPPFCKIIAVYIKHKDERMAKEAISFLAQLMQPVFGDRVLGPDKPPVSRVQHLYVQKLMLKIEHKTSYAKAKKSLLNLLEQTKDVYPSLIAVLDVDPM